MHRLDHSRFSKMLAELLSQKKPMTRAFLRGMIAVPIKPRTPLLWGGVRMHYPIWWGASLLASVALPGIAAIWFNLHGRPLPGAAYHLVLPLAVLLGWPAIALVKRAKALRNRPPMEARGFQEGVHSFHPAIPEDFVLALRKALAAAYCVPTDLISYADTPQRIKAFSPMSEPLAVEIIAYICLCRGIQPDPERMLSAAEILRTHRPSTVVELIQLLHTQMSSARLQS